MDNLEETGKFLETYNLLRLNQGETENLHRLLNSNKTEPVVFPGGSHSKKKSACNMGELGSILGWGDPLEEGMATHSSILAWRIPVDRGHWWATVHGITKSQTLLNG